MPRIVSAQVMRSDGRTFEAKLANLTSASLFLLTREPLAFRERVMIEVLGVDLEGVVAFAISEPRLGAVIAFRAPAEVREVLAHHEQEIEVFTIGRRDLEPTTPPPQVPPLGEGVDLETVDEIPGNSLDPDTLVPFEEAAAGETPTPQNMPVIGAPTPADLGAPVRQSRPSPGPESIDLYKRPPLQRPPAKREEPTIPGLPPERPSGKVEPARAPTPPAVLAPRGVDLPVLAHDGCTVLFTTHPHFRAHYETTMMHGGIIVRADPMLVGQQRALVLRIAQLDEHYSLVARVAFNGKDGSVGFMIEAFLHHRPMLEALAAASR